MTESAGYEKMDINQNKEMSQNVTEKITGRTTDTTNTAAEKCCDPVMTDKNSRGTGRKPFIIWMQGLGIQPAEIISCVLAVEKCGVFANSRRLFSGNILSRCSPGQADQLYQDLTGNEEFVAWNAVQGDRCLAALEKYVAFCHARDIQKPDDSPDNSETQPDQPGCTKHPGEPVKTRANHAARLEEPEKSTGTDRKKADTSGLRESGQTQTVVFPGDENAGTIKENGREELLKEIRTKIEDTFREGATCIYLEQLMRMYGKRLADIMQIRCPGALKEILPSFPGDARGNLCSYIYMPQRKPDPGQDVIRCVRGYAAPVAYEEVCKKLWYIPENKTKHILAATKEIVCAGTGTYFYAPDLPVHTQELEEIIVMINQRLSIRASITEAELKELTGRYCPAVSGKINRFTRRGLYNALAYLLGDEFSFQGRMITKLRKDDRAEAYARYCREHERLSLDDIKAFAAETGGRICWETVHSEMVRISGTEFLRNDQITFDCAAIDAVLEEICPGQYMPLADAGVYAHLPVMEIKWNDYLLESYVRRFSPVFHLMRPDSDMEDCCGVIVRRESSFADYNALVVDFLARSDAWSGTNEAEQLLTGHGFIKKNPGAGLTQTIRIARIRRIVMGSAKEA